MTEAENKKKRFIEKQIDYLINYMMTNQEFAAGKFQVPQGKQALIKEWKSLTEQLNELGPAKSVEQWKRVWKNQKMQTRKRSSNIKMAQSTTGNLTPPPPLSDREKNILGIIGTESSQGLGLGEGSVLSRENEPSTSFRAETYMPDVEQDDVEICALVDLDHDYILEDIEECYVQSESESQREILISHETQELPQKGGNKKELNGKGLNKPKRKPQYTVEYKELVNDTNRGLQSISHALNNIAKSNEHIADTLQELTNVLKEFFKKQD